KRRKEIEETIKEINEKKKKTTVIKGDVRVVNFNPKKIKAAINKAFTHVYASEDAEISELVKDIITKLSTRYGQELTINQIQRVREEGLVACENKESDEA